MQEGLAGWFGFIRVSHLAARLSLGLQSPEGSLRAGGFFSAYSHGCGRKFPSLAT